MAADAVSMPVRTSLGSRGSTYVLPRAGGPTSTMAILPEWKSLPDMVLYN